MLTQPAFLFSCALSDHREQFFWPPRDPARPQGRSNAGERRRQQQLREDAASAFTYGEGGFNPALRPSNAAKAAASMENGQGEEATGRPASLRKRASPGPVGPVDDGAIWSSVPPYHPDYGRFHARRFSSSSSASSGSSSAAEEAGVVNAGCIPPGTIPGSGVRPGEARPNPNRARRRAGDDASSDMEEHELLDAAERRRWGAHSGETFPRLFAENEDDSASDLGSEGYGDEGDSSDDQEDQRRQLHSRVRRGSEGYEVRPMMYDEAYAANAAEEEERLRSFIMAERERLGRVWDPDAEYAQGVVEMGGDADDDEWGDKR